VGQDDVVGRAPARAAGFQQRGVEPAAMLVGAFQIHHLVAPAVDDAVDLEIGESFSSAKACVEPESNQTSRMSSTFSYFAGS
jgi:hypothetical protein